MKIFNRSLVASGSLAVLLSIASWGVLSQGAPAADASISEVQAYIELKVREKVGLDEVVTSGLALGYRPEVLAAALIILKFEPAEVAVALARQGVSRRDAAKAVITVAGKPSADPVLEALLLGISPTEGTALRGQVAEILSVITSVAAQDTPGPAQQASVQSESTPTADNTPAPETQPSTVSVAVVDAQAQPEPSQPGPVAAAEGTALPQTTPVEKVPTPPPPLLVGSAPPTPPIQGGGGGATRN